MSEDVTRDAPPREASAAPPVLALGNITKAYGPTLANNAVSVRIGPGEVVGLVGANGAGKSTLMRILAGVTAPDSGNLTLNGAAIDLSGYSPSQAREHGIRFVHQELSLCDNLSVLENFYLEQPSLGPGSLAWRGHYRRVARESIAAIFPASGIDVSARVRDLPIAQRQMVEIARAASDPKLKLLILDEPTSSLDAQRSAELRRYIGPQAARGVSFVFISHRLREVTLTAGRVLIMQGGRLISDARTEDLGLDQIVEMMVGGSARAILRAAHASDHPQSEALVEVARASRFAPEGLTLHRGEIIGVAGLEGNGQRRFLHALYTAREGRGTPEIRCAADAGYVSGDRVGEGVLPLWSVLKNATLGHIARLGPLGWLDGRRERQVSEPWMEKVRIDPSRVDSPIVELSGGNQQKVLMARALITSADVLILDDPTRGVDVAVKREFYRLIAEAAASGKLVVWYSSEDIEFLECSRVLVFDEGSVATTLAGEAISEDAIVAASFRRRVEEPKASGAAPAGKRSGRRIDPFRLVPFATTVLVFGLIVGLNANAASLFGIDLLMSAAVPLVYVAIGQMFVIGGSEIDLGIGTFSGLINVLSATLLVQSPVFGALTLTAALVAYCALGVVIYLRQIPSLVVTLGGAFIWSGIGYALQPTPGGERPNWLAAATSFTLGGLPASVCLIVLAGLLAAWLNASRTGVVLRGFGNAPKALRQSGWSPSKFYLLRFLISGICALLAGLSLTGVNSASDINAGGPYTLLSVAAVVIGGCELFGGNIAPIGVVCGAVTLTLVGGLLGFLNISTDFNAAVQGGLLIVILVIRTVLQRRAP